MKKTELTVEEAIIAMVLDGEVVVDCGGDEWEFVKNRFYVYGFSGNVGVLSKHGPFKVKPKTRPMTRLEVLEKVANDPSLITRSSSDGSWCNAANHTFTASIENYDFAHIKNGEIVGIHKAEVEE